MSATLLDAKERPVLYSFRRCPYAMRARLSVLSAGLDMEIREVVLRNKPDHMTTISPKATVPVLQLPNGEVIEESLDIMHWALGQSDPKNLMPVSSELKSDIDVLIDEADNDFKHHLDRYKYPNRYENAIASEHREAGCSFLRKLDDRLSKTAQLFGDDICLADYAIFPFVRQFANVDREWFDGLDLPHLHRWLNKHLESNAFQTIMVRRDAWQPGQEPISFP